MDMAFSNTDNDTTNVGGSSSEHLVGGMRYLEGSGGIREASSRLHLQVEIYDDPSLSITSFAFITRKSHKKGSSFAMHHPIDGVR